MKNVVENMLNVSWVYFVTQHIEETLGVCSTSAKTIINNHKEIFNEGFRDRKSPHLTAVHIVKEQHKQTRRILNGHHTGNLATNKGVAEQLSPCSCD